MMDAGRKYTDKQVAALERQLKKEYQQAYRELTQKSKKMLERYRKNRLDMLKRLEQGEISKDDFDAWVDRTMYRNLQMEKLIEEMSERMVHADQIAAELINGRLPATYAENFNYCSYLISIQAELNLSFTIINEHAVKRLLMDDTNLFPQARVDIPKDKLWNQKKIRSALTQGMLQGESIPKIAKRLQRVTDMDRTAAVRNARTLMTGANSAGRLDSMYEAKALGLAVKKVWVAQLDNRTRDTHVDLDGEERELDQEFSNGMDRPGGSGPPEEVYNCRCNLSTKYDKYKTDMTDLRLRNITKMEQKSYEEWKSTRGTEGRKAEREFRKAARERERAERQNKRRKSK